MGTIFLRNFYTGFDYYHDSIVIGLNKGTTHAEIRGSSPDPFKHLQEKTGAIVFVMIFLVIMVVIALFFFFRAKKLEKERTVTFAPPSGSEPKKRYRNGVEIKPSEGGSSSRTAINESANLEEEFLDAPDKQIDDEEKEKK